jgi:hypothetical protein
MKLYQTIHLKITSSPTPESKDDNPESKKNSSSQLLLHVTIISDKNVLYPCIVWYLPPPPMKKSCTEKIPHATSPIPANRNTGGNDFCWW